MVARISVALLFALATPPEVVSGGGDRGGPPASVELWGAALAEQEAGCRGFERSAARRIARGRGASRSGGTAWETRYERCPFAPHVGTLAMIEVWARAETLPYGFEAAGLEEFEAARTSKRRRLLAWSVRVRGELARRGLPPIAEVFIISAGASLAVGEVAGARRALREGVGRGAVAAADARWIEGASALVMLRHEAGLRALGAAVTGADRHSSRAKTRAVYLHAVLLDRLGDRDGAAAAMRDALVADKDQRALRGLVRALPIHEALYARALARQFSGRGEALTLRLWAAYLSRPEPEAPERALAQRHMDSLAPRPTYPR